MQITGHFPVFLGQFKINFFSLFSKLIENIIKYENSIAKYFKLYKKDFFKENGF